MIIQWLLPNLPPDLRRSLSRHGLPITREEIHILHILENQTGGTNSEARHCSACAPELLNTKNIVSFTSKHLCRRRPPLKEAGYGLTFIVSQSKRIVIKYYSYSTIVHLLTTPCSSRVNDCCTEVI